MQIVPIFSYSPVFPDDNEKLTELEEIDYLQSIKDAVASGDLDTEEAKAMIAHQEELNAVR